MIGKFNIRIFLAGICIGILMVILFYFLYNDSLTKKDEEEKNSTELKEETFRNVLVRESGNETITIRINGEDRTFSIKGLDENLNNVLADVEVKNGRVTTLSLKRESISGKVLSAGEDYVEIEGFGKVDVIPECHYYYAYKDYEETDRQSIGIGNANIRFMVEGKSICGVIVEEDLDPQRIRVLIKNTGFTDVFHDHVSISCSSNYKLSYYSAGEAGNVQENVTEHDKSETLDITADNGMLSQGRIRITPIDENAKIVIGSIMRNGEPPEYRGTIEVALYDGRLVIVNDLLLEEYLYAVVPSEMPSSYGVEALKVQAVCARSYAVSHLGNTKLSQYGAQVDDSIDYQVYNNSKESENAIAAVKATYGETLRYGGGIVNAYFFATSCGSTTDSSIWGGESLPYIQGKILSADNSMDLTDNDVFGEFIKGDVETYDSGNAWYRWNISMSTEEISQSVNGKIAEMSSKYPNNILLRQADGTYINSHISTLGNITNIQVLSRGSGGIIEELLIEGDTASVKVIKQSTIRNLINPYGVNIQKCDGTAVDSFTALPSAFFTVEKSGDTFIIYGGGYGHGAGMSQTAVRKMIEEGMKYQEILQFFYTDTVCQKG